MGSMEKEVLKENLSLYPKTNSVYSVLVTKSAVSLTPLNGKGPSNSSSRANRRSSVTSNSPVLDLKDIVGCECMKGKTSDDKKAYLTIYAYPHSKKFGSEKTLRNRQTITLTFAKHENYMENSQQAAMWKTVLNFLVRNQELESLDLPEGLSFSLNNSNKHH